MRVYPDSTEEKLGFSIIREELNKRLLSPMGRELWENSPPSSDTGKVAIQLAAVSQMQDIDRYDDPFPFATVQDIRPSLRQAMPEGGIVPPEGLIQLEKLLRTSRLCARYLEARIEKYPALRTFAESLTEVESLETRIHRTVDNQGNILDSASSALSQIRRELVQRQNDLRERTMKELRRAAELGYASEDQPTIRNGRMVIPVHAEAKRKIQGFIHDHSGTGQTAYIEPAACLELNNEIRSLENEEIREIDRILREVGKEVRVHVPEIRENVVQLAEIDVVWAKARLSNRLSAEVPALNDSGTVHLVNARNPVLALRYWNSDRKVIPLDLTMDDQCRTLVITGPNAGGKSVALKTVGLFALMLGYGMPVPTSGKESSICLFDGVYVDIGDEQSIENDLSTFSSHLHNLKQILESADGKSLVLIDEAGTGTDPIEGSALAQAILEHLTASGACSLVTTHHGGLKVFAHNAEKVENGAMQFDRQTLTPTYQLQVGVPGSSYAFEMAHRMETPVKIIDRARELVGVKQSALEDLIASFEEKNRELRDRLSAVVAEQEGLAKARHDYENRRRDLSEKQDVLREKALDEAAAILKAANAQVERTIREIKEAEAARESTRAAREDLEQMRKRVEKRKAGIQKKQSRKAKPDGSEKKTGPLTVGDQVVVRDGHTAAELVEIRGKQAVIVQGSMRFQVPIAHLTKVGGKRKQKVTVRTPVSTSSGITGVQTRIDLRGKRVDEALAAVTRLVDNAIAAGLSRVEILHGTGTGALRIAIREWLEAHGGVMRVEEAPWDQGGPGVTFAILD